MAEYVTVYGNAPVTLTITFESAKEAEDLLHDLQTGEGVWDSATTDFFESLKDAASPPKLH